MFLKKQKELLCGKKKNCLLLIVKTDAMKKDYDTVVEALNALKKQGYKDDINLKEGRIWCNAKEMNSDPADFIIDEVFRFEGITDPADEAAVYAISSDKHNVKGVFVAAFGHYADRKSTEVLNKIKIREKHE